MIDKNQQASMSKNNPTFEGDARQFISPGVTTTTTRRMKVVNCGALTTRKEPSKLGTVVLSKKGVGCIPKGTIVTLKELCEDTEWCRIITEEGKEVFVMSEYLEGV